MMINVFMKIVILSVALLSFFSKAEVTLNGFASIIAGKTLGSDEEFLADAVSAARYDNELSFTPESRFGLQLNADLNEGLKFTVLMVAKAENDYDPDIDQAYITYQLSPDWKVKAGRLALNIYQYSDYLEVGYAYNFMRPPTAVYYAPLSHYDGANLTLNDMVGRYAYEVQFLGGQTSGDATYSSEVLGVPVEIDSESIWGVNGTLYGDDWEAKLRYVIMDTNLSIAGSQLFPEHVPAEYLSGGYNKQWNNWDVNIEASLYSDDEMFNDTLTYFVSTGYRIGKWMPTIGYAMYDEDTTSIPEGPTLRGPQVDYSITSFTLRYDFHPQAAFKVDFSQYEDKGETPYVGDSDVVAFGIDLIF